MKPELSYTLQAKLGSLAVHAEEMLSDKGHHFDVEVIKAILGDAEVRDWLDGLRKMAMLPVKR